MKKIVVILFGLILILFAYTNICYGLNATFSSSKTITQPDEEIILTIKFNAKVTAANFNIKYDSSVFDFIEGVNINAAEKDGKIACIYADSTLKGTDSFSIKFKAVKESNSAVFSLNEAKIRESGKEESVTTEDITGLSSVHVEVKKEEPMPTLNPDPIPNPEPDSNLDPVPSPEPSTKPTSNQQDNRSTQILPAAGTSSRYIIIISAIIIGTIAIISKKKFNNLKMI